MKKIILSAALCSFSLLAFAGGPDQMGGGEHSLSGFSFGVQGGIQASTLNSTTNFDSRFVSAIFPFTVTPGSAAFNETNLNYSGFYGASVNWSKWFNKNVLMITLNYNRLIGQLSTVQSLSTTESATTTNSIQMHNIITPKNQYNAGLTFKHFITQDFDISAGAGFSTLKIHSNYYAYATNGTTGNGLTGQGATESTYLFGGYMNVGGEYFMSKHTSLNASLYYFLYSTHQLNKLTGNQISTMRTDGSSATQNLARKIQFSMPAITFGFNYYI
jgi:hypothetical protein